MQSLYLKRCELWGKSVGCGVQEWPLHVLKPRATNSIVSCEHQHLLSFTEPHQAVCCELWAGLLPVAEAEIDTAECVKKSNSKNTELDCTQRLSKETSALCAEPTTVSLKLWMCVCVLTYLIDTHKTTCHQRQDLWHLLGISKEGVSNVTSSRATLQFDIEHVCHERLR